MREKMAGHSEDQNADLPFNFLGFVKYGFAGSTKRRTLFFLVLLVEGSVKVGQDRIDPNVHPEGH